MPSPASGVFPGRLLTVCGLYSAWMSYWILYTLQSTSGLTLAPVYWNSSNPMFKPSINNPVIEVQLRDEIDFVCPWDASNGTDGTTAEYYVIYQVSKKEYDSCSTSGEQRRPLLIVNCNAPEVKRRFTVIFEPYQSIPNVPEYKTGMTYYYTTTSTGRRDGLNNSNNGACQEFNMKLAFYICCPTTTTTVIPRTSVTNLTTLTTLSALLRPLTAPSEKTTTGKTTAENISRMAVPTLLSTSTAQQTKSTSLIPSTSTSYSPPSKPDAKTIYDTKTSYSPSATTKITQIPQPSYQQTINACNRIATDSLTILLTLTLARLCISRTQS